MRELVASSLGKKYLMALTGLLLIGFVIAHMLGNLQVFLGPNNINAYGQSLKDLGPLLWVARIGLIVIFVVHVVTAIQLSIENKKARPEKYSNSSCLF